MDKFTFMGKDLEDMSKEELIEAVKILGLQCESAMKRAVEMNRTWAAIVRAGRRP